MTITTASAANPAAAPAADAVARLIFGAVLRSWRHDVYRTKLQPKNRPSLSDIVVVGVVSASGGSTTWMQVPGDPRNNYLARMDWADNATELAIQQLNRRQPVTTLWFADAASGKARSILVDRDSAWIDIYDDVAGYGPGPSLHWTPDHAKFIWVTERDGWRHAWLVDRSGKMDLITMGNFDVMKVVLTDIVGGWLYYYASPTNGTQMFLWRTRLDGTGEPQRLTPAGARGMHDYDVSPRGGPAGFVRILGRRQQGQLAGQRRRRQGQGIG